ncbi:MAG: GNAT family N-acetyltransferase, partial [Flavobacteriales bacterium]
EEHKNWYKEKLTSSNALLLVNEYNKTPAGLVRFEIKENQSTVGILIANEYRGKGLSFRMLTKSIFHYFNLYNQPVFAYIKESNKASIKAFEKAGFYFFEKTTINSFPTFVYKIEKNE